MRDFSDQVASLAAIPTFKERDSLNYPDGHYYKLEHDAVTVSVAVADHIDFPDYNFWLTIRPKSNSAVTVSTFTENLARKIALAGHEVAIALGVARPGGDQILYKRRESSNSNDFELEITRKVQKNEATMAGEERPADEKSSD